MHDDTVILRSTLSRLEQRLGELEIANSRLKAASVAVLLVVTSLVTMGVAPSVRVPEAVAARTFELVDDSGQVRGRWSVSGPGSLAWVVIDDRGNPKAALRLSAAKPYLALEDGVGGELAVPAQGRPLFSWGESEEVPADEANEKREWPSWGGEPEKPRSDDSDFDWDTN